MEKIKVLGKNNIYSDYYCEEDQFEKIKIKITAQNSTKFISPKTRLQDFLEKHPNAKTLCDGTPKVCCADLGYCNNCIETDDDTECGLCWNQYI